MYWSCTHTTVGFLRFNTGESWDRVRALFATAAKKEKRKRKKRHDSMRSQRKCKFTSTVAGGMHPAGSKNSPRRYCSLVACPTCSRLVSFKRRIPRFTDTIPRCWSRFPSLLVKRKDIGFADRYFCGNRMRKRCLIRKRISISTRDTDDFFRPLSRRKFDVLVTKIMYTRQAYFYVYYVYYIIFSYTEYYRIIQHYFRDIFSRSKWIKKFI